MARVIITIKVMPASLETNLEEITEKVKEEITAYGGEVGKEETEPVAFGLNAKKIIFILDESKGVEELEKKLLGIKGVSSADIIDVRRQFG